MALTAARTELNVSLVGEDETIRMLEDAKKRMGELEAKTRTLTGATKAQTDAAKAQQGALEATNGKLMGMAKKAEGVVEGVDKVKGAFEKVMGVAGFLGSAVTGVVTAITFLTDVFDDSEEESAKLTKQLEEQKKQMDATKAAADRLAASMANMASKTAAATASAASERIRLAKLTGDMAEADRLQRVEDFRQQNEAVNKTKTEIEATRREGTKAMAEADRLRAQSRTQAEELLRTESAIKKAKREGDLETAIALGKQYNTLLVQNNALEAQKKKQIELAAASEKAAAREDYKLQQQEAVRAELLKQVEAWGQVKEAQEVEPAKPEPKPRGGGGARAAGPTPDEIAEQVKEQQARLRALAQEFRLNELDEEKKHQRRLALAGVGDENLATLRSTRDRVAAELASLPQGAMAAAFAPLKTELEKRLTELDALAKQHAQMGVGEYFDQEQADKVLTAWESEQKAIEQVNAALSALGETRAKATEESEKMREAMARALPADVVNNFTTGLEQLSQIQAPVFEAVQESLAGVAAQMGKFKEGQTSLTAAIVGSASAIAGAVAKKVGGVKAEAGVRAAFEVAMGIATAFTNPAESVGHFAAATAFGLLAGGVIKPSGGGASGGQKAPAAPAAATREGTMGGGGGTITNVYNLQTGIVDGQSTAMAFRRAEMTARNTGMASAGGW